MRICRFRPSVHTERLVGVNTEPHFSVASVDTLEARRHPDARLNTPPNQVVRRWRQVSGDQQARAAAPAGAASCSFLLKMRLEKAGVGRRLAPAG